jgi:hypothetical protein
MKQSHLVALAALLLPLLHVAGATTTLQEQKSAELKEINRQVLAQILDLAKYEGKDIYIKAKILDQGDGKLLVKVEKITVDKTELAQDKPIVRTVYLKGKVGKAADDAKFKLDLEHVLPPDSPAKQSVRMEKEEK